MIADAPESFGFDHRSGSAAESPLVAIREALGFAGFAVLRGVTVVDCL